MERIYLHIGIAKTGTTSIQVGMDRIRDQLAERGICYPKLQKPYTWNHGPYVGSLFVDDPLDWPPNRRRGLSADDVAQQNETTRQTIEEAAAWKPDKFVLSGEGFFYLKRPEIDRLIAWLKSMADDIRILVYFREPKDWANSYVQQLMKRGLSLDTILARRLPVPPIGRLKDWIAVCGRENVTPFDYGAACRHPHSLGGHFVEQIGAPELAPIIPDIRVNSRLPAEALDAIASATAQVGRPLKSREIKRIASKYQTDSRVTLPESVLVEIEAAVELELDWLAKEFGLYTVN